jgi:hypothetical protein
LDDLIYILEKLLRTENIQFWAVNRTLLGTVRHGGRIPWDDKIELAVSNADLKRFVNMRKILQQEHLYKLVRDENGYRFMAVAGYPYIKIHIMGSTGSDIAICTPHNELGECSYRDSQTRQREVFTENIMFPLVVLPYTLEHKNVVIYMPCAHDYETCLITLFGKNWETTETCPPLQPLNNSYIRSLAYRLTGFPRLV